MTKRTLILLVLALLCGGSAAVGVNQLRQQVRASGHVDEVPVVIAARNVAPGTVLTNEDLRVKHWPASLIPPGAHSEVEEVLRRSVRVPLVAGEPVLEAKLSGKDSGPGLAALVPPGMRAFTIRTPHVAAGVGGFIQPGNRVDVLLTTRSSGSNDPTGGGATTTLLQNVKIIAVDQRLDAGDKSATEPEELKSVTLLVTPDQAAKLDLGMNVGTLHLALRNPEDDRQSNARPATMAELRFHQEDALPSRLEGVNELIGKVAGMFARGDAGKKEEDAAAIAPRRPTAHIRTLRGSHRGNVRIQGTR